MGFNVFLFCVDRIALSCISFVPAFIVLDKYQIYDLESFLKKKTRIVYVFYIFFNFYD